MTIDWTSEKYQELTVGHSKLVFRIQLSSREIELVSLRTPQKNRGQGSAREALLGFLAETSLRGFSVWLCASPLDKRTNLARLVRFYQSCGFEFTGKACNMAGDPILRHSPI